MSTNFLNLWILARLTQSAVAAGLCGLGAGLGVAIAWRWRAGQSSEAQLALERRAELVAAVMQVALLVEILGLALSVLVADHLVGGIRGAMCAFGVLASTRSGYPGLLASALSAGPASPKIRSSEGLPSFLAPYAFMLASNAVLPAPIAMDIFRSL